MKQQSAQSAASSEIARDPQRATGRPDGVEATEALLQARESVPTPTDTERDIYFMKKFKELSGKEAHSVDYRESLPSSFSGAGEGIMMRDYKRRGVDAELKRLHPSRRKQCSDALDEQCAAVGLEMEHLGITIAKSM